jgi:hypothetical protein
MSECNHRSETAANDHHANAQDLVESGLTGGPWRDAERSKGTYLKIQGLPRG